MRHKWKHNVHHQNYTYEVPRHQTAATESERNDDDQLTAIKMIPAGGGGMQTLASYAYDFVGRLISRSLTNGVVTAYTYDAVDNVTSITMTKAGAVLWSNVYGYDALGRRTFTQWADGKGDKESSRNNVIQ